MTKPSPRLFALSFFLPAVLLSAPALAQGDADRLAREVVAAAGDPYQEAFIGFSFVVERDGKELLRRSHAWCPREGVVEVGGVRISAADGRPMGSTSKAAAEAAWSSFVNDMYWVFAPVKLMDAGVKRSLLEDGRLRLSFAGVGLTPGDVYTLRFDEERRLAEWSFVLQSGKEGRFSWEDYTQAGGLRVAQAHHSLPKGAGPSIMIEDLRVADRCPL